MLPRPCAKAAQLLGERGAGILVAAGDDEAGALVRERNGSGPTDARQRAGDQNHGLIHIHTS